MAAITVENGLVQSAVRSGGLPTRMGCCLSRYPELRTSVVIDVGCGDGKHLAHFGEGSIGIDGRRLENAPKYRFIEWNFDLELSSLVTAHGIAPQRFVWCSDVLEHHPAPHRFLLDLRRCLIDDGILLLGVPLVNPLGSLRVFSRSRALNFFRGYLSQDHVNFYTYRSLRSTVEFAGFDVIDWYSPFLPLRRPPMFGLEPITVLMLRKNPTWQYGPKAYKTLDENGRMQWKKLSDYTSREVPRTPTNSAMTAPSPIPTTTPPAANSDRLGK